MSRYKFVAIKSSGEKYNGERIAQDKFSLYDSLKRDGETIVSFKEINESWFVRKLNDFNARISSISTRDKINFAKNLGTMIEAGLPLSRSIYIMEKQAKNPKFKKILSEINAGVSEGRSLSDSMSEHPKVFSKLFISMVKAGEESGKLSNSLKIVAEQSERNYLLLKKVKGAMIYPAVILGVLLSVAVLMLVYVVPGLSKTFKDLNVELPISTKFIIFASDFAQNHYLIAILSLVFLILALYQVLRTKAGRRLADWAVLRMPIIAGLSKQTNTARTARTLSSLLSSGVDFLIAIKITKDVIQNSYYKKVLDSAMRKVEKGDPISGVFLENENLYPPFVGEMASIGEETGKLSEMLSNVAKYYENEVEEATKDMSTIVEPILMVVIGLAVGFFAISIISPIYSLSSKI